MYFRCERPFPKWRPPRRNMPAARRMLFLEDMQVKWTYNKAVLAFSMLPSVWSNMNSFWCFGAVFAVVSIKFSASSVAQHKLYVKEHKVRDEKRSHRPLDRTLFVLNVPPYCSEVSDTNHHKLGSAHCGVVSTLKRDMCVCLCFRLLLNSYSHNLEKWFQSSWEMSRGLRKI